MEKKKDKNDVPCEYDIERMAWDDLMNVVSGNDCTGLMPRPPITLDEAEAYNDIYDVPTVESKINTTSSTDRT